MTISWEFLAALTVFIGIIFYRFYFIRISSPKLDSFIREYYDSEEFEITLIRKLTLNEKFRYRETSLLHQVMTFGTSIFPFSNESYFRVLELVDNNGNEYQKYIEILIVNKQIDKVTEFDSYEI